ncbi:hypothetical protein QBC46DRAFT_373715 [Diplogelasinospora grovesii]|uniref:Uncharacterized protein n=1 Tax=Diplogelasinospora grovesii TaxID=303347 RepID=A0AAN6S8P0_9PEZI|nr:hypothetical protein QBC46DRAFT_373715 [Diplogelasinospora grovesii]
MGASKAGRLIWLVLIVLQSLSSLSFFLYTYTYLITVSHIIHTHTHIIHHAYIYISSSFIDYNNSVFGPESMGGVASLAFCFVVKGSGGLALEV